MLIRRLRPYHVNVGKRLVKSPKTYIRDSGVLHALLGISSMDELLGHPIIGGSWEGFVIENILSTVPSHAEAYFYRTSAGAEIDLVLSFDDQLWAIEIKRSTAPKVSKGFHHACADIQPTMKWLIYPGSETYQLREKITVTPLVKILSKMNSMESE
jgi:predicted AAA+ superfamily ATPase